MNGFYEAIPFRRLVVELVVVAGTLVISSLFLLCVLMMVVPVDRWGGHVGSRSY